MKLIFLFLTLSLSSQADQSPLSKEQIEEIVLTDVYPLSLGNDGVDCAVELVRVKTIFSNPDSLYLLVKAYREPTQYGCAPAQMDCKVWINLKNLNDLNQRDTKFSCI